MSIKNYYERRLGTKPKGRRAELPEAVECEHVYVVAEGGGENYCRGKKVHIVAVDAG